LKTYSQHNFFKHTFCEFQQIDDFTFPENENYKSKSESSYYYTDEGVYRKSNHWGRVANCRWKLVAKNKYKNQETVIAFAEWTNFYPLNSTEKIFYIDVNFEEKLAKIIANSKGSTNYLFTFSDAQKRIKQIQHLFADDKWTKYFDLEIEELRFQIITNFINSDKKLQEIKINFK
jgi:hypothetical protein